MPRGVSATKRKMRKFTAEYNAEVVTLVRESGKTIGQSARELDLTETTVRAWVERATIDEKKDPEGPLTTEERAELARLRREVKRLEMACEILEKLTAVFVRESA